MTNTQFSHRNRVSRSQSAPKSFHAHGTSAAPAATVLIVDDEKSLRDLLEISLRREGYQVFTADSGEEALAVFNEQHVDLIVLDAILPGMDGFEVCTTLRERSDVPIVMLTALNRSDDVVRGFDIGADDYILKPFTFREVEARLQAILRRVAWLEEQPDFCVMAFGDVMLNDEVKQVSVRGSTVDLTPIEYQLLYQLMQSPDQPVGKNELFKAVWGYEQTGGTNLVEVAVRRLREKIESTPSKPNYLVTVRGVGYKFNAQYARTCEGSASATGAPSLSPQRIPMAA